MTIADLRKDYMQGGLSEAEAGDDPFALFKIWFEIAVTANLPEPNAMALATSTLEGRPSVRFGLLKGTDERGFTFFSNYDSRKGNELAENPYASVAFLWDELERQVRIEGRIERVSEADSDAYFQIRPIGSRLGAWASAQSAIIPDRAWLEAKQAELMAKYPDGDVPRPPHWGGYRLLPDTIEFWQGRRGRLHDRIQFTANGTGSWEKVRLSP